MISSYALLSLFRFLLPPALISTIYIYLYPLVHGCEFPEPLQVKVEPETCYVNPQPSHDGTGVEGGGLLGLGKQLAHTWHELTAENGTGLRGRKAPFRLLALGDPQLEGDTSLPDPNEPVFPSLQKFWRWLIVRDADDESAEEIRILDRLKAYVRGFVAEDIPRLLGAWRKRVDLWGNDYYLAHVYRSMHWWTAPTHVTVLGDLVGSQWIDGEEFESRSWRFWNRVFKGGKKIEDPIALGDGAGEPGETLGIDGTWENRIINIAGNHDIGYAGEIDESNIERFRKEYGRVNWHRWFNLPQSSSEDLSSETSSAKVQFDARNVKPDPAVHLVVLNSMNLDGPVYNSTIQSDTYNFVNQIVFGARSVESRSHLTVLLTHIPLHKREGVCIDAPYFSYYEENAGLLKEQNHLSEFASEQVLQSIFGMSGDQSVPNRGMGRNGVILTGHDHEGCDVWHFWNRTRVAGDEHEEPENADSQDDQKKGGWAAVSYHIAKHAKLTSSEDIPGIREITVRSMMGEFGGNAGMLSAWYEEPVAGIEGAEGQWKVEYAACPFVIQHVWWAVHILDLVMIGLLLLGMPLWFRERKVRIARNKDWFKGAEAEVIARRANISASPSTKSRLGAQMDAKGSMDGVIKSDDSIQRRTQ
ncbi:MAG: hypothetical protein M1820_005284 [Bogoriella megaspora]|nr:MAG: hypothetical protein M1820_005284 [Bogoriella megaspora]